MSRFVDITVSGDLESVAPRARRALARIGRVSRKRVSSGVVGMVRARGIDVEVTIEWKPSARPGATLICLQATSDGASGRAADSAMQSWIEAYQDESDRGDAPAPSRTLLRLVVAIGIVAVIALGAFLVLRR